jgi:RNA polymerase sigma-70 factor (sigma-E family)
MRHRGNRTGGFAVLESMTTMAARGALDVTLPTDDDGPVHLRPDGFDAFFAASWPTAFKLASFLVQDTAAGEDVAQDAFAALSQRWERVDEPAAYLRRCIVNTSHNVNRRRSVARRKLPLLVDRASVDLQADELADALARLPFRQRAVVVLRFYEGLSEREIATALDCRPGTVKSLSSRALAALASALRDPNRTEDLR